MQIQEKEVCITASFGITGFDADPPGEKISFEAMIGLADKLLYQAKHKGRDRAEVSRM